MAYAALEWEDLPIIWVVILTALAATVVAEVTEVFGRQPLAAKSPIWAAWGMLLLVGLWVWLSGVDFVLWSTQDWIVAAAGWLFFVLPLCRRSQQPHERVRSLRQSDAEDRMMAVMDWLEHSPVPVSVVQATFAPAEAPTVAPAELAQESGPSAPVEPEGPDTSDTAPIEESIWRPGC